MKKLFVKIRHHKTKCLVALLFSVLVLCVISPLTSSAKMVDVYTKSSKEQHLELEWVTIHNENSTYLTPKGGMLSQKGGKYSVQTSSYVIWYEADSTHFACLEAPFNTGKDSVMTLKVTFDSDVDMDQFGIMVRKNLEPESEMIWANFDSRARLDYRETKGAKADYVWKNLNFDTSKDVHLKLVITKGRGLVDFYIKKGGNLEDEDGWTKWLSKSMSFLKNSSSLYVGVVSNVEKEGTLSTVNYSNFSVNLQAPEGYSIEDGTGGAGGDQTPQEPEVKLPEDLEAAGDALLYETFTDNDMFPENSKDITVTNPLWKVRTGTPIVALNEAKNNRYLSADVSDDALFLEVGDMKWTDYSVQVDVLFPDTVIQEELNRVRLMVRQRTATVGGVGYYGVTFYNKIEGGEYMGQYLALERKEGTTEKWIDQLKCVKLEEVKIADEMISTNTKHTLKVEAFDNTLTVYLDDMTQPLIRYTDESYANRVRDPHLVGGVGFIIEDATVQLDNLVVRKLQDPLGGDYDNAIMGDYDQPIPAWIEENYMN